MARTAKVRSYDDAASLKKALKKGGGTTQFFTRLKEDESVLVRFLTEPYGADGWVSFKEHYFDGHMVVCTEPDCDACASPDKDERRQSKRWLANVILVDEDTVVGLAMPKTLTEAVNKAYEKYGTVTDRDFELSRSGSGLDTTYSAWPEEKRPVKLSKYEPIDLFEMIQSQIDDSADDEEDDEEETPKRPVRRATKKIAKKPLRRINK
jgi:hypothetical protein